MKNYKLRYGMKQKQLNIECHLGLGHIFSGLYDHSQRGKLVGRRCIKCNYADSETVL